MIVDSDHVVLPEGVSVGGGHVEDIVRGCRWPLNDTGGFVLGRVGTQIDVVVRELADAYCLPLEVARRDVLQFTWTLNALAIVNIVHDGSRLRRWMDWLVLAARLIPAAGASCPGHHSTGARHGNHARAVASVVRAVRVHVCSRSRVRPRSSLLPLAVALGGLGGAASALGLGAGTGIGVGLHEAGHVVTLRGVPSALVLRGRRTFVLHAPVGAGRRSLVAISGPATTVAVGLALVDRRASARFTIARDPRLTVSSRMPSRSRRSGATEDGMRDLKAFLLGAVAVGILAYAAAASLAVATQAAGSSLRLGVGRIVVVSVESDDDSGFHDVRIRPARWWRSSADW